MTTLQPFHFKQKGKLKSDKKKRPNVPYGFSEGKNYKISYETRWALSCSCPTATQSLEQDCLCGET